MSKADCSVFGIKLAWGPGTRETPDPGGDGIGFSERAYSRWKCALPVGTRMLIYETSKNGGRMSIVNELEVSGTFGEGVSLLEHNPEHTRMLPVRILHKSVNLACVPLSRIREVLGNDRWPHQGLSWQPVNRDIYEELLSELLRPGEKDAS